MDIRELLSVIFSIFVVIIGITGTVLIENGKI